MAYTNSIAVEIMSTITSYAPSAIDHLRQLKKTYEQVRDAAAGFIEEDRQRHNTDPGLQQIHQFQLDLMIRCLLYINGHLMAAEKQEEEKKER